jgi:hypothetical protein
MSIKVRIIGFRAIPHSASSGGKGYARRVENEEVDGVRSHARHQVAEHERCPAAHAAFVGAQGQSGGLQRVGVDVLRPKHEMVVAPLTRTSAPAQCSCMCTQLDQACCGRKRDCSRFRCLPVHKDRADGVYDATEHEEQAAGRFRCIRLHTVIERDQVNYQAPERQPGGVQRDLGSCGREQGEGEGRGVGGGEGSGGGAVTGMAAVTAVHSQQLQRVHHKKAVFCRLIHWRKVFVRLRARAQAHIYHFEEFEARGGRARELGTSS